jgi:hypothetical protein
LLEKLDALTLVVMFTVLMASLHRDFGVPLFALVWHVAPHGTVFFDTVLVLLAFTAAGLGAAARLSLSSPASG